MSDTFTSTTRTGFFSRMKNAVVGTLMGIVMVPASIGLLSWNEYRTIHRTHGLNEGAELVQSVENPGYAPPELTGKLIHLNDKADTKEILRDEEFGVEETAIRLSKSVEMFQWVERKKRKKKGNRKTTTYKYKLEWESGRQDHSSFHEPNGHENPAAKFHYASYEAKLVNLGVYRLNDSLKGSINSRDHVEWSEEILASLPAEIRERSTVEGHYLYWSKNGNPSTSNPQLGDQRIAFNVVRPTRVSLVAGVAEGNAVRLEPFKTSNGEELQKLYVGDFSAAEVFEKMQGENSMWAWILRGGGFLVSFVGFTMIFGVLSAFTESIPLVGSMTRGIIGFVAFLMAVVLTTLTIAFAWVAVRPLIAIPLIVVGVGAAVMAWRSSRGKPTPPSQAYPAEAPAVLSADDVV